MSTYINEPLVQDINPFIMFMGGNEFLRHTQKLRLLANAHHHWRGTRIKVDARHSYGYEPQVTVKQDDFVVHCNHVKSEIEPVFFNAGHDNEYHRMLAICQVCELTTDENGEEY